MEPINSEFLRKMPLPDPGDGGKERRGNVLVVAGSKELPGGALLAGIAALRSGAGRLQIATDEANASLIGVSVPEARVLGLPLANSPADETSSLAQLAGLVERADAVLLGPGLSDDRSTAVLARTILSVVGKAKVIFDAGALKTLRRGVVAGVSETQKVSAITPHAGEMAGLLDAPRSEVEADMPGFARRAASEFNTVVALKGSRTIICEHDNSVQCEGHVGLATSGSGDVLAGLIAGLVARGMPPFSALCWGVYAHAEAGFRLARKIAPIGFLARELLDEIPGVLADIQAGHGEADGKTRTFQANNLN